MSEENKKVELNDEELKKVTGGYTWENRKPVGYSFYASSNKTNVLKITHVLSYAGDELGYLYKIDQYYSDQYCNDINKGYYGNMNDSDIDWMVSIYGRPE